MNDELEEITPPGSVAPVFLDPNPVGPFDAPPDLDARAQEQAVARETGRAKLRALGLTDDEIDNLGGPAPFGP